MASNYDPKNMARQIAYHEGYRKMPYKDSLGIDTIGIGYNLEERGQPFPNRDVYKTGVTREEANALASSDIKAMDKALTKRIPNFGTLNAERQKALIDLTFNMGVSRFMGFVNALDGVAKRDFNKAADNLLYNFDKSGKKTGKTPYYTQVGKRAERVSNQLRTGQKDPLFSGY